MQVTGVDSSGDFAITSNFVQLRSGGVVHGAYVDLPVMRQASVIRVDVQSIITNPMSGNYRLASLTEMEIFVEGDHVYDRLV